MSGTLDDLKRRIRDGNVIVFVGAGVSQAATGQNPVASWDGLLKHGVQFCSTLPDVKLPDGWVERMLSDLGGDEIDWLSVAEQVSRRLDYPEGHFPRWLRETIGKLDATNPDVIQALHNLDAPLATTNYDSLLEDVIGSQGVTWKNKTDAEYILRKEDRKAILHLHGFWRQPASVVLGIKSYEGLLDDEHNQSMIKSVWLLKTVLFVGFGAGMRDPNFGALRRWARKTFCNSQFQHYRLARESECTELKEEHAKEERITILSYGKDRADLVPFLSGLAPKPLQVRARRRTSVVTNKTVRLPSDSVAGVRQDPSVGAPDAASDLIAQREARPKLGFEATDSERESTDLMMVAFNSLKEAGQMDLAAVAADRLFQLQKKRPFGSES